MLAMAHAMDSWSRRPPRIGTFVVLAARWPLGLASARGGTGGAGVADSRREPGDGGTLLVEYLRILVADQNLDAFGNRVAAR
jgi:hypothetical protein